jgi:hypothetical protein
MHAVLAGIIIISIIIILRALTASNMKDPLY